MNLYVKIKSWFATKKERRAKRKSDRAQMMLLKKTAVVFETLNKFKDAGLIYLDFKHKNVTISNVVASMFIYNESDWQNFLHNVHSWVVYQYSISEYVRLFHKTKADAEATAYEKNHAISHNERQRVRIEAAETFDIDQVRERTIIPDLNFIVIGASDGKPIVVARLIDGVYETAPVPDSMKP